MSSNIFTRMSHVDFCCQIRVDVIGGSTEGVDKLVYVFSGGRISR